MSDNATYLYDPGHLGPHRLRAVGRACILWDDPVKHVSTAFAASLVAEATPRTDLGREHRTQPLNTKVGDGSKTMNHPLYQGIDMWCAASAVKAGLEAIAGAPVPPGGNPLLTAVTDCSQPPKDPDNPPLSGVLSLPAHRRPSPEAASP